MADKSRMNCGFYFYKKKGLSKKIFDKKEKGAADNFLYAIITVIILFVFLIALLPNFSLLNMRNEVNQIARGHMLRMEALGCLTSEDASLMKQELMNIKGISNAVVQSNHMAPDRADYGEELQLTITIEYSSEIYDVGNILSPKKEQSVNTFVFRKSTTAKNSKSID